MRSRRHAMATTAVTHRMQRVDSTAKRSGRTSPARAWMIESSVEAVDHGSQARRHTATNHCLGSVRRGPAERCTDGTTATGTSRTRARETARDSGTRLNAAVVTYQRQSSASSDSQSLDVSEALRRRPEVEVAVRTKRLPREPENLQRAQCDQKRISVIGVRGRSLRRLTNLANRRAAPMRASKKSRAGPSGSAPG